MEFYTLTLPQGITSLLMGSKRYQTPQIRFIALSLPVSFAESWNDAAIPDDFTDLYDL